MIAGVDEAGRGALVGNVIAAAVILPASYELPGLTDSKKLSARQREALYAAITAQAVAWSAAAATPAEIDALNIHHATLLAMQRALAALNPPPSQALIDGKFTPTLAIPARAIVGGDASEACIAAASIIAKVTRDREMLTLEARYPGYGFAAHKGYGTQAHLAALARLGATPEHRRSYAPRRRNTAAVMRRCGRSSRRERCFKHALRKTPHHAAFVRCRRRYARRPLCISSMPQTVSVPPATSDRVSGSCSHSAAMSTAKTGMSVMYAAVLPAPRAAMPSKYQR